MKDVVLEDHDEVASLGVYEDRHVKTPPATCPDAEQRPARDIGHLVPPLEVPRARRAAQVMY